MKKTILFQGDSITDSNCRNEWGQNIGFGYATMVAGALGRAEPYCYNFINKGISGNRIVDLYARIKKGAAQIDGIRAIAYRHLQLFAVTRGRKQFQFRFSYHHSH